MGEGGRGRRGSPWLVGVCTSRNEWTGRRRRKRDGKARNESHCHNLTLGAVLQRGMLARLRNVRHFLDCLSHRSKRLAAEAERKARVAKFCRLALGSSNKIMIIHFSTRHKTSHRILPSRSPYSTTLRRPQFFLRREASRSLRSLSVIFSTAISILNAKRISLTKR